MARAIPSRCCSPGDNTWFQWASSESRCASAGSPTSSSTSAMRSGGEFASLRRIAHRRFEAGDREIRPLWQHHQFGAARHLNGAGAERPQSGDCTEEGRLSAAGRSGDQRALARLDEEIFGCDERRTVWQVHRQSFDREPRLGCEGSYGSSCWPRFWQPQKRARRRDGAVESIQALNARRAIRPGPGTQ